METRGILLSIKQVLPSLPEQERRVGDYVLHHPHEAMGCSINRLAAACGVGNTTISRFCRRLGLTGYGQFKIALAKESGVPENLIYVQAAPGDTLAGVAQKIFAANIQALHDTQRSLDLETLERVVDMILGARRVDIYATGGASIAGRELYFKCLQLGINANTFPDSQMQVMSAASMTAQDVGFGISHTGMQRHVAEALQLARSGGASTIALTSYPGTPVAQAADTVLYTASLAAAITYDSPSVRSAQLAIVDVMYEAMLLRGLEATREQMARVARAITAHTSGSARGA